MYVIKYPMQLDTNLLRLHILLSDFLYVSTYRQLPDSIAANFRPIIWDPRTVEFLFPVGHHIEYSISNEAHTVFGLNSWVRRGISYSMT